jgi:hypothetical protein
VLERIEPEHKSSNQLLNLDQEITRTLGIQWDPNLDVFVYNVKLEEIDKKWSKRTILSEIARLFDPVGWLAPVIIKAKVLLQQLWLQAMDWDYELSGKLLVEWETYRQDLKQISKVQINRWIGYTSHIAAVELHGFSDASITAYAGAVYLVVEASNGDRCVNLIMAKTKVAPIKTVSLPRLELCAAHLVTRLMKYVKKALKLNTDMREFAWTDSQIVLAWLQEHPVRWTTFVANRVSAIHRTFTPDIWRHVASAENPADCASRGITSEELACHPLWWAGPKWLGKSEIEWPTRAAVANTDMERKKVILTTQSKTNNLIDIFETKYSTFWKIIRVFAYVLRFINKCKKGTVAKRYLTAVEMDTATLILFKLIQEQYFEAEIRAIKAGRSVQTKSKIINLNPFIDANGHMRVGGRLKNAALEYGEKTRLFCHLKVQL